MLTAALPLAASLATLIAAATGDIDRCRAADVAFDVTTMIEACGAAADDPASDSLARGDALRRLALGYQLSGHNDDAEAALVRLLVLFPNATLTADLGPRWDALLARARQRVQRDGALAVDVEILDEGATVAVRVLDRLGRVRRAELLVGDAAAVSLGRVDDAPGRVVFSGSLPRPTSPHEEVTVRFVAWDGSELERRTVRAAVASPLPSPTTPSTEAGSSGAPATRATGAAATDPATTTTGVVAIVLGAPLVVGGVALGTVTAYELYLHRVPCAEGPELCAPMSVFFDQYRSTERDRFFTTDGPAFLVVSLGATVVGALLSTGGALLLATPPDDETASAR